MLSNRDISNVLGVVGELYPLRPVADLQRDALTLIMQLVPADSAFYNENDIANRRARWFNDRPDPAIDDRKPVLERHMHQHPLFNYYQRTHDGTPMRISDFLPLARFERTELYDQFYRPQHIRHQMILWLPSESSQVAIGLDRKTRDFSDREKLLLTQLHPHIVRAFSNCALHARLSEKRPEPADEEMASLTSREREVLHWLGEGKTNTEISIIVDCAPRTAQKHVENILRKLGVENRLAAALRLRDSAAGNAPAPLSNAPGAAYST